MMASGQTFAWDKMEWDQTYASACWPFFAPLRHLLAGIPEAKFEREGGKRP